MSKPLPRPYPAGARLGLTTTIPVEVVLAAGLVPVDLNNLFIASPEAATWVAAAEGEGLPRTICAWIKGIYSALRHYPEVAAVIAACQGDCSYTQALGELLEAQGVEIIHFRYPYPRQRDLLARELAEFMARLGTDSEAVAAVQARLTPVRENLKRLDRLTWERGVVSGRENFQWLIASSDFGGDYQEFSRQLTDFLTQAETRSPSSPRVRLGLLGIPPIFTDFWDYLEELEAAVVFNEIPRQFSMPHFGADLVEQYYRYTYPYDIGVRLQDVQAAIEERRLDGLIHYTQSFCFRQMYDRILRETLEVPILTIEGDRPAALDSRTRMRLEAFVDVLR